jgi:hypothetical protein
MDKLKKVDIKMQDSALDDSVYAHRLLRVMRHLGVNAKQLSDKIGCTDANISKVFNDDSRLGGTFTDNLKQAYPEINLNWLMSGMGSMLEQRRIHEPARQTQTTQATGEIEEILHMDPLVVKMELVKVREASRIYKELLEQSNKEHGQKIETFFGKIDDKLGKLTDAISNDEQDCEQSSQSQPGRANTEMRKLAAKKKQEHI